MEFTDQSGITADLVAEVRVADAPETPPSLRREEPGPECAGVPRKLRVDGYQLRHDDAPAQHLVRPLVLLDDLRDGEPADSGDAPDPVGYLMPPDAAARADVNVFAAEERGNAQRPPLETDAPRPAAAPLIRRLARKVRGQGRPACAPG